MNDKKPGDIVFSGILPFTRETGMSGFQNDKLATLTSKLFFGGLIGILMVLCLDLFYWNTPLLAEGRPNFSPGHILRSIVILISVLAILWALVAGKNAWAEVIPKLASMETTGIITSLVLGFLFLAIFILSPVVFNHASREDGIVEWSSAVLLFLSCFVFISVYLKSRQSSGLHVGTRWLSLLFAIGFFVMAMEEISWFQRVLMIETPSMFNTNLQNEMNLHNFATNIIENIYYWGAFVFTVLVPFLAVVFPGISAHHVIGVLVPRPFVAVVGAIACGYNYDMWNIVHIQVAFFSALAVLLYFAVISKKALERWVIICMVVLLACSQVAFLVNGRAFDRLWNVTEYKEFFIPLAFYVYSLSAARQFKANPGSIKRT